MVSYTVLAELICYQSEDDGQGGRRKKKGLKDKIKEKLPGVRGGGGAKEHSQATTTTTTSTTTTATHPTTTAASGVHHPEHEKKSFMEKIKEKFPGHHNH